MPQGWCDANLDSFCAHRRQRCAGRDEETDFEIKSRNRRRKRCAALANSLTKKAPYKGLGADSEEKREPVSDIDTAVVDSLKVLDLKRPIREADIASLVPGKLPRSLPVDVGISKRTWICLWRRRWREQAAPTAQIQFSARLSGTSIRMVPSCLDVMSSSPSRVWLMKRSARAILEPIFRSMSSCSDTFTRLPPASRS